VPPFSVVRAGSKIRLLLTNRDKCFLASIL
jgi:hypothetical protein